MVESNKRVIAIGDGGNAHGAYQIHKIYVDDVNRIAGTHYTYKDRTDKQKSREMVRLYLAYYGNLYVKDTKKRITDEVLARIHNGGPYGWRKKATDHYWAKIKRQLNAMNE